VWSNAAACWKSSVNLISDIDEAQDLENSVSLMTLHSAKGLEFPIVIMVGLEEGIFPHERSMGDEFELEEERRLCYVGITRAQRLLYLTYAHRRTIYGETRRMQPSRFLSDLPAELVDWRTELSTMPQRLLAVTEDSFGQRVIGGRRIDLTELLSRVKSRKRAGKAEAENATPQVAASGRRADRRASGRRTEDLEQAASLPRFAVGERVVHDKFGEGVVVTTQGEGPDGGCWLATPSWRKPRDDRGVICEKAAWLNRFPGLESAVGGLPACQMPRRILAPARVLDRVLTIDIQSANRTPTDGGVSNLLKKGAQCRGQKRGDR